MDAHAAAHPTEQTLSSFGLGKLEDASAEAVNKHLEQCPDCRKRVAEMSADSFLGRVRDARGRPESPAPIVSSLAGLSMLATARAPRHRLRPSTLPPGLADHPDYEIIRELGRGGMGVVYLAHNRLMGRDEVLKVVGQRTSSNRRGVLDRFLREIRPCGPAPPPQHRHRLLGVPRRREPRLRHGVRRGPRPGPDGQGPRAAAGGATPAITSTRRRWVCSMPTSRAWSTATSSPATSCSHARATGRSSRCSTSAWPRSSQRGAGRTAALTSRGPDAGHARLHRAGADRRRAAGRHPRRHLQPGLHPLLPADRRPAVPRARASTTSSRRTTRWTPRR